MIAANGWAMPLFPVIKRGNIDDAPAGEEGKTDPLQP